MPSSSASRGSNVASSMRPSSNANSSSWASGVERNPSRSASLSMPSAVQKAANESNRLVVITPPQSTSSPLGRSVGTLGHLLGPASELEHALAEGLQVGVVGRAGDGPLVVALHEHDRLPERQGGVPAQIAHR